MREYCFYKMEEMFTAREEKFLRVKSVKSWYATSGAVMFCECVTRISGLHQGIQCCLTVYSAITR